VPRHVVLVCRDASLGVTLRALLSDADRVSELEAVEDWPTLPKAPIDTVVVDLPHPRRMHTVREVRAGFGGRLVLVLDPGDDPAAVPAR
jgi:hypothetical protein